MTTKPTCIVFAKHMARVCGTTYAKAVKQYPRGFDNNSVYIDGSITHSGHCVHCARAEAMMKAHSKDGEAN